MTLQERLEYFKIKGYTCNFNTGHIFSPSGYRIKAKTGEGYIALGTSVKNRDIQVKAHQFVWFLFYGKSPKLIDHINGDRSDNRIINLRQATNQQNCFNRQKVKGYTKRSSGKFQTSITINGKKISIGYFQTEQEAHQAYLDAKKIYHIF